MMDKIDHIGIAVKSLEKAIPLYKDILGLNYQETLNISERGVRAAMFDADNVIVELLEPLNNASPIQKFLEKHGEGIHHIAFQVKDIESTMRNLSEKGMVLTSEKPVIGAHGSKVVFISPKSANGVLIELVEKGLR